MRVETTLCVCVCLIYLGCKNKRLRKMGNKIYWRRNQKLLIYITYNGMLDIFSNATKHANHQHTHTHTIINNDPNNTINNTIRNIDSYNTTYISGKFFALNIYTIFQMGSNTFCHYYLSFGDSQISFQHQLWINF